MQWQELIADLARELDGLSEFTAATAVAGGDINAAFMIECGAQRFFVKLNSTDKLPMFEQEAQMLEQVNECCPLRVPRPFTTGVAASNAYIVMEHLNLAPLNETNAAELGEGLAVLHQSTADHYGWDQAGYIGSTRQPNENSRNWCEFWQHQRLGFQQKLAIRNGLQPHIATRLELLTESLPDLIGNHHPVAALLHGDLWHGNCGLDETGRAVLFDPACYYGDPEADLALTELFGGFTERFYQAYWHIHPRAAEYEVRSQLYQLYHVLNHFNIFGGLYGNRAGTMVELLLAEIGH